MREDLTDPLEASAQIAPKTRPVDPPENAGLHEGIALETRDSLAPKVAVPMFGGSGKNDVLERLSGRDWVAIVFAGVVLCLIVVTGGVIVYNWSAPVPDFSRLPIDQQKEAIERFKDLNDVLAERTGKMFDLVVTKALLPLLATLVGFILGTKTKHSS